VYGALHQVAQRPVYHLVLLDPRLALECRADHGSLEVVTITLHGDLGGRKSGLDELFQFVCLHANTVLLIRARIIL